ncbi:MAG: ArsA family ATPase [Myxococcota bacterium]
MNDGLEEILSQGRCIVCVGPGGVGKTSTAGALAVECASRSYRTIVLTIDPARRLANALGLPEIGNLEKTIEPEAFSVHGLEPPQGRLSAMMLDIKEAWDDVVQRYHPDPSRREQLFENPMYQALSTALAGSQEYMAMEKLYQLSVREEDRLDRIVLDTPPANHAVDFLDAPNRIIGALSNDATKWFLQPFRQAGPKTMSRRLLDAGSGFFVRTISRLTGTELLEQLAVLLEGFQAMLDGFEARAEAVQALLSSEETRFIVVSGSDSEGLKNATAFARKLHERGARLSAMILNRGHLGVSEVPSGAEAALRARLSDAGWSSDRVERVLEIAAVEQRKAEEEAERAREVSDAFGIPVLRVPELPRDVADLGGLADIRGYLVPGAPISPPALKAEEEARGA